MVQNLPPLPFPYNGLEPHISEKIMILHHTKHHQGYVHALNDAEKKYVEARTPKERIALQAAIKFNGGGHINHTLFWHNLAPSVAEGQGIGGLLNDGKLRKAISDRWGTLENMKAEFNAATMSIQGSGWGWLAYNIKSKSLEIVTTANQDPLLPPLNPIIGVDIWEHAFYLQYLNVKADYLTAIWNVINFVEAERRFERAIEESNL